MCRLLIGNRNGLLDYDQKYDLRVLLEHLEAQLGGHGNGYCFVKDKTIVAFEKGVKLGIGKIMKEFNKTPFDWFLFHTRIASVSDVSDRNSHPFICKNSALAMNGTERSFSKAGRAVGKTDSELIFDLVKEKPLDYTKDILETMESVFVGFVDGLPYAVKNNGDLVKFKSKEGVLFASSMPIDHKSIVKLPYGYSFVDGVITQPEPKVLSYNFAHDWRDMSTQKTVFGESEEFETEYEKGFADGYEIGYDDGLGGLKPDVYGVY